MDWQEVETRRLQVPRSDGYLVYSVDVRLLRREESSGSSWRAEGRFVTGEGRQEVAAEANDEETVVKRLRQQIEDRIAADASYDAM